MKTKQVLVLAFLFGIFATGCNQKEEKQDIKEVEIDLLNVEFPDAKQAVKLTLDSIAQSVKAKDIDQLIAFHAYSPKFTEFKDGEPRNGGQANEDYERGVFGSVTEVEKFNMDDLKIAVYGDIANVTLHTDFHLKFGDDLVVVNEQMSLLFLNTKNGWRIVHEHHSPLKMEKTE